jgi:hypothetical protein
MKVDLWVALIIGSVPLLVAVFGYFANKRNIDKKANIEEVSSVVDNAEQIQGIYSKSLDDLEKFWNKRLEQQKQKYEEDQKETLDKVYEKHRAEKAVLLVEIEDLKLKNAKLSGIVQGVTGDFKNPLLMEKKEGT